MQTSHFTEKFDKWNVSKIAVVGPGIVGMPMAALLADSILSMDKSSSSEVVVIQRNSPTSGWKVAAINAGHSPIGGVEPDLQRIVSKTVSQGVLRSSHDYNELGDADVILVCVQTDKKGFEPDYGPLLEALTNIASTLKERSNGKNPLIIFESTLAPSSMATVIKTHFSKYDLEEGRDILLGNSPNRVMPGRLVERVAASDKIVAGLSSITPGLIKRLYSNIVTSGTLHTTNSMTAEVVKTLENAYRDVRIAYSAEMVRYCDRNDIDFYVLRDEVNTRLAQIDDATVDANAVPSGGLLIPTVGVGGHCLPKDGILLWWRKIMSGADTSGSLILESRTINDESPRETIDLAEGRFGDISGKKVALLGGAYRFNSEDTRNSPTFVLARHLMDKGCDVTIHDPHVKPDDQNLVKFDLQNHFTNDLKSALYTADYIFVCTAHREYLEQMDHIIKTTPHLSGIFDGCNLYSRSDFEGKPFGYAGIGRGTKPPVKDFSDFVYKGFRLMERGVANEVKNLVDFLNDNYALDDFNRVDFDDVRHISGTCVTGCEIVEAGSVDELPDFNGFSSRLGKCAFRGSR